MVSFRLNSKLLCFCMANFVVKVIGLRVNCQGCLLSQLSYAVFMVAYMVVSCVCAAFWGRTGMLKLLHKHGAKLNIRNRFKETALDAAK